MIAPSSDVGSCIYCAFQFFVDTDALTASKSSSFQYSGHTGFPFGSIAGNSTTFHLSALGSDCDFNNRPVRSSVAQRVMTTQILPPGCKRCLGPELYHSYARSIAVSDIE